MIDGRENKSKESDFMKMKKILVSMFLLFFAKQYTISCVFVKGQKRELDFYGGFIGQKENARYHNSSKN